MVKMVSIYKSNNLIIIKGPNRIKLLEFVFCEMAYNVLAMGCSRFLSISVIRRMMRLT